MPGSADGVVSQALHTSIEGVDSAKADRFAVLVQPQCVLYAPSIRVKGVRAREAGDYAVSIDLQYTRIKLSSLVIEDVEARGGTRGLNISTGASSLGCDFIRIAGCNIEASSDRCILATLQTPVDHIEIIGGRYKRGNTTAEVIHVNNTAAMLGFITVQGVETSGGTTGVRCVNTPTAAIITGSRFAGWATAATTGLTASASILNSNNLTA